MKKLVTLTLLLTVLAGTAGAQDRNERVYLYPVLNAQKNNRRIPPKPKVEGWADQRVEESLNRGVVVLQNAEGQVYVSWRLLKDDPEGVAFNVYRSVNGGKFTKANSQPPVTATTDFIDAKANASNENSYMVRAVVNGKEQEDSEIATQIADGLNYRSIKLNGDYVVQKVALADLNGDGKYDFIVKQPGQTVDPGVWRKSEDTFKIEAYLSDGTFLWSKDLGWNIEQGVWYSPFIVFDFNGNGRAEIAVKTAPTSRDYRNHMGRVVGNPKFYYENGPDESQLEECPEFCSILDGMTGEVIDSVPWPAQSPRFGDYVRNNRNQMGVAYLDGKTPCLLLERGTYRAMALDAYQLNGNKLEKLWSWDGDEENLAIRSQGAHQMVSVDLDGDGRDEIVLGSVTIDDNGEALWSTGLGHPDKAYVAKVHPDMEGLQVFYALEVWHEQNGVCLVDGKTGEFIWTIGHHTTHVGDGVAVDFDPASPGLECFATEDSKAGSTDKYLFNAFGERMGSTEEVPGCREWIWWDGELTRETTRRQPRGESPEIGRSRGVGAMEIIKYPDVVLTSGIEGRIMMIADVYGDWREEIITMLPGELRIYSTTIPAKDRRVTLMQDPLYRNYVAHRSMGYDQPPTTSYYLGTPVEESPNHTPLVKKWE